MLRGSREATKKPHALHTDVVAFAVKKKHPHKSLLARRFGVMLIDSCEGTSCEVPLLYRFLKG